MPVKHLHQILLRVLQSLLNFLPFPPIALFLMELTIVAQFQALRVNKWRKKSPLDEKFLFQFHNVESRCF